MKHDAGLQNLLTGSVTWRVCQMHTVSFLTGFWGSGSSYYRLELPASALEDAGWRIALLDDVRIEPNGLISGKTTIPNTELEIITENVEVIVTQRWMNEDADQVTRNAREAGQKILADLDDHYWELPSESPTRWATDPLADPFYNRDHYWNQLAACDAVICSTPELQKYLNDRVDVATPLVRNMINLDLWTWQDTAAAGQAPRVGWAGSTRWRQADLVQVGGAVGGFVNDFGLGFVHVGYRPDAPLPADLLGINHKNVEFQINEMDFGLFPQAMKEAQFDIGIIPMEETAFNRAKSCLKGMEYAACGIPFVASPLPEYERLGIGILAKTPHDWANALCQLLDPDYRALVAQQAYERVKEEDYRVRGSEYNDLLEGLLN